MPKTYHCGECGISCEGVDSFTRHVYNRHRVLALDSIEENIDHIGEKLDLEVFGDA